jgi:Ala-tRNA(Pro) deacylase
MATPLWIRKILKRRGIPFEELHHPEVFTAQEMAEQEHVSGHRVAKVVGVMADGEPLELILPASRRVRLDWVSELLGAIDVRLATEDELRECFADCELGAIPALRHWRGVEVVMDAYLETDGDIFILGGTHHDAVRMRFDDWFEMVRPRVEGFSEPADGAATAAGTPWAVRPLVSVRGRVEASPAIISEKKMPMDRDMPEFWKVDRMPDAEPRCPAGTELMIAEVLGAANRPEPTPLPKISSANSGYGKSTGSSMSPTKQMAARSSPEVANSRGPYRSDSVPETGPAIRKPAVSGSM